MVSLLIRKKESYLVGMAKELVHRLRELNESRPSFLGI